MMQSQNEFSFSRRDFDRVRSLIHSRAGISRGDNNQNLVYGRLSRRIRKLGMHGFNEYLDYLDKDTGSEWTEFTNALTTNLTSFFRESHHFEILKEHLRRKHHSRHRIWSAASSTGEEPYSIAITACEAFGSATPPVDIVATDLDTKVLEKAAQGVYELDRIEKLSKERQRNHFFQGSGPNQGKCRVKPHLQKMITFSPLNLLAPKWPIKGTFDVIFCRNVMIYFDKQTQYKVIAHLLQHLHPDGLLMAGHSESFFHAADLIQSCGNTVYRPVQHQKEQA